MSSSEASRRRRPPALDRVDRVLLGVAAVSALATLAFVVYAYLYSPQNPVAAEMQFEALRVARKLPLYVDPFVGAWEDGPPPARYFVLYTPMFPFLVGKLAAPTMASVELVGRTIAVLSWLAIFIPAVVWAPSRRTTAIAAMLGASVYFTARHAASMSPDALATALVCGGVLRAVIKDEIDPLAAAMLIAAPFIKPSCLGGVAGATIVHVVMHRKGWWRGLVAGAVAFVGFAAICHWMSGGAWLSNIKNSTGQPLTLTRWVQEMGSRIMVLGIPHVVVAVVAWRKKASWLVVGPLVGSIAWATFMMAKHGSGSHYWFEPTGLAVIAISRTPGPAPTWARPAATIFALIAAVTSWPAYLGEPRKVKLHDARIAALNEHCTRGPGDFVASSDFDVEMQLNGRINVPMWQTAFLARTGKFPADKWQEDLARPQVKWVAIALDPRVAPGTTNDQIVELSPFYDILEEPLFAHFDFDAVVGGMWVFKRSDRH